jgi:hypothetical protein
MSAEDPLEADATLVLDSSVTESGGTVCWETMTADADPDDLDAVHVTYTTPASRIVEQWREEAGELPASLHVVYVQEFGTDEGEIPADVDVATANPNDLTGLAMRIRDALEGSGQGERELAVCFDSVTALLQYGDVESAYKFVHMFTGQLREYGANSHFHLDPEAYDEQTVGRLTSLFDEAVDVS